MTAVQTVRDAQDGREPCDRQTGFSRKQCELFVGSLWLCTAMVPDQMSKHRSLLGGKTTQVTVHDQVVTVNVVLAMSDVIAHVM